MSLRDKANKFDHAEVEDEAAKRDRFLAERHQVIVTEVGLLTLGLDREGWRSRADGERTSPNGLVKVTTNYAGGEWRVQARFFGTGLPTDTRAWHLFLHSDLEPDLAPVLEWLIDVGSMP